MSSFIQSGSIFRVARSEDIQVHNTLPPANYAVDWDEFAKEFFLKTIDNFVLPKKIYGNINSRVERVLNTFNDRAANTGILLNGIKGAGKTLLAKKTAVVAATRGIPTIVINKNWHGDPFNTFIQKIDIPTIILFDEFEKVYGWEHQRKILTLFDGVFPSKKLFMVTSNREDDLIEFFMNRPGRIYYKFSFDTLEKSFIKEFCDDNLKDKTHIPDILRYADIFSFFNFDMLSAVVEEMNRYGESLNEVLTVLNIVPENKRHDSHQITLVTGGENVILEDHYEHFQPHTFDYVIDADDDDIPEVIGNNDSVSAAVKEVAVRGSYGGKSIRFKSNMIVAFDRKEGKFTYRTSKDGKIVELHVKRNKIDPYANFTNFSAHLL